MTNETKQTTGAELMRKIWQGKTIVNATGNQLNDWHLRAVSPQTLFYYKEIDRSTIQIWRTKILNNDKRN